MWRTVNNLWHKWVWTSENLAALVVCLILIAVVIMTTDQSPLWIYQGF